MSPSAAVQESEEVAKPVPRLTLRGIEAGSSFAQVLLDWLGAFAELSADSSAACQAHAWRNAVRGTALQWFGPQERDASISSGTSATGIVLDLFADTLSPPAAAHVWRVVDGEGRGLLAPFAGLRSCHRRPYVDSLFVIDVSLHAGTHSVLAEAHVSNRLPYRALLDRRAHVAGQLLASALRCPRHSAGPTPGAARVEPPNPLAVKLHRLRVAAAVTAERWQRRLVSESWAIGEMTEPPEALLSDRTLLPGHWIAWPDRQSYVADPFPWFGRDGTVLCERFDKRSGRGEIAALTLRGREATKAQSLPLGIDCHLSYPFTWEEQGRVYCLPEMGAARRTVLYELDRCSGSTSIAAVIQTGVAMADPTLFRWDGRYWLAYTDTDLGLHDNLCLMFADRLEGPWTPHQGNPVKTDIRSSRPGGTPFLARGALFRPAQDCSRTYGGAIVLNRVVTCTPTSYEELPAARLRPDPAGPYPDGLHTVSIGNGTILIDGKRLVVQAGTLMRKFSTRLAKPGTILAPGGGGSGSVHSNDATT